MTPVYAPMSSFGLLQSRKQLEKQRAKVKLEIGTFRLVEDHPNAVRVLEVFEGAECYYICMECCEGGGGAAQRHGVGAGRVGQAGVAGGAGRELDRRTYGNAASL